MKRRKPSSERRRQVKQIFQVAVELDTVKRAAYLAEACQDDPSLRAEVESLIIALEQSGGLLDIPDHDLAPANSADDQGDSLVGESIGRYRILEALGRGGMGEVYKAIDTTLGRELAIKVLPSGLSIDQDRLRRFEQEARAASALNHPNIITIYELGRVDGVHFIATELVEGRMLRALLKQERMAPASALPMIAQVASALEAAHAAGIIHRDIKPENIMVRNDGLVKVVDFGLAKLIGGNEEWGVESGKCGIGEQEGFDTHARLPIPHSLHPSLSTPGIVMGTASYMSPEQARGLQVDARADIFSLGVVLYEMTAGRKPFAGDTANDVIAAILNSDPSPLSDHFSAVPAELEWIVGKALRKDPEARYQTTKEFNSDLMALRRKLGIEGERWEAYLSESGPPRRIEPAVSEKSIEPRARVRGGKRKAIPLIVAVCAAFIAAISATSFWAIRRGAKDTPAGAAIESIAILPFKSLGPEAGDEYLAVGMADALGARLSRTGRIIVRPISDIQKYAEENRDPLVAGREQQVDAALDGSFYKSEGRIRVSARLIDTRDGTSLWSGSFDEKYEDLFFLQDSIVKNLAARLWRKLTAEEERRLTQHHTESTEASEAYAKGRWWWNKRSREGFNQAIRFYNEAIALDRNYALPYTGLADCYLLMSAYGITSPKESYPKAKAAATQALAINSQLAEAHTSLAHIAYLYDWDFKTAEEGFKRAILLDLNYPVAHQWYSVYLSSMGRHDEAITEAKLARKLDPLSLPIIQDLSRAYYHAGLYNEAIGAYLKVFDLNPGHCRLNSWLEMSYAQKGFYDKAIETRFNAMKAIGVDPKMTTSLRDAYTASGWKGFWRKHLELSMSKPPPGPHFPYSVARIHARLGENDLALEWLERAYDERLDELVMLKVDPVFEPLRSDLRFQDLLQRIGFLDVGQNPAATRNQQK